jgi:hypothetical protein
MRQEQLWGAHRARVALAAVLGLAVVLSCAPAPAPAPPRPTPRPTAAQGAKRNPPADHIKDRKGVRHKSGGKQALQNCSPCHGADLKGGAGPSCYTCHDQKWK